MGEMVEIIFALKPLLLLTVEIKVKYSIENT